MLEKMNFYNNNAILVFSFLEKFKRDEARLFKYCL